MKDCISQVYGLHLYRNTILEDMIPERFIFDAQEYKNFRLNQDCENRKEIDDITRDVNRANNPLIR